MENKDANTYKCQEAVVAFCVTRHSNCHWKGEVYKESQPHCPAVAKLVDAVVEIAYFFRNIGVPDQHELHKVQVTP